MAEQAIYSQINGAVTALSGRIYPMVLPQDVTYPAVTYQRISATRYSAFGRDATPAEAVVQVDIYDLVGKGFAAFNALTESVRNALQRRKSGDAIDMMLEGERDDYEEDTDLLRKSFDVRVWYREA